MIKVTCAKCDGTGQIRVFNHVQGGVCFSCGGEGYRMQKSQPRKSAVYAFSFQWLDETDENYAGGDFVRCFKKKAASLKAAEKMAQASLARNGAQAYRVEPA